MAKKMISLILVIFLLGAVSAVLAKDSICKLIDPSLLEGKKIKIVCGGNGAVWDSVYHRNPNRFNIEFDETAHILKAERLMPHKPLYKGTYVARFSLESYEGGRKSGGINLGWRNRANGDLKPFTAKVSVTITEIVGNHGEESAPIAYNTVEVTEYSGYVNGTASVGQIFGTRPSTSAGTRVYPIEAERAAIAAAIPKAASGLLLKVEKKTVSRDTRDGKPHYSESSQPRAEEEKEDVLIAPPPSR